MKSGSGGTTRNCDIAFPKSVFTGGFGSITVSYGVVLNPRARFRLLDSEDLRSTLINDICLFSLAALNQGDLLELDPLPCSAPDSQIYSSLNRRR